MIVSNVQPCASLSVNLQCEMSASSMWVGGSEANSLGVVVVSTVSRTTLDEAVQAEQRLLAL